jgi:hypothetical protein
MVIFRDCGLRMFVSLAECRLDHCFIAPSFSLDPKLRSHDHLAHLVLDSNATEYLQP